MLDLLTNTSRTCIAACDTTYYTEVSICKTETMCLCVHVLCVCVRVCVCMFVWLSLLACVLYLLGRTRKCKGDSLDGVVPEHGNIFEGRLDKVNSN